MARVRYCDLCSGVIDGEPVVARQVLGQPGGVARLGPGRRYHPDCVGRLGFEYRIDSEWRIDPAPDDPDDMA